MGLRATRKCCELLGSAASYSEACELLGSAASYSEACEEAICGPASYSEVLRATRKCCELLGSLRAARKCCELPQKPASAGLRVAGLRSCWLGGPLKAA